MGRKKKKRVDQNDRTMLKEVRKKGIIGSQGFESKNKTFSKKKDNRRGEPEMEHRLGTSKLVKKRAAASGETNLMGGKERKTMDEKKG